MALERSGLSELTIPSMYPQWTVLGEFTEQVSEFPYLDQTKCNSSLNLCTVLQLSESFQTDLLSNTEQMLQCCSGAYYDEKILSVVLDSEDIQEKHVNSFQ